MILIAIATEDELSEVVVRRILQDFPEITVSFMLRGSGYGYLKKNIQAFNQSANGIPFLVLTDLDRSPCASALISEWFAGRPRHRDLLFRVAVREVEAWLLADPKSLARFLGIHPARIPGQPDSLPDPKHTLVQLAARSKQRAIREDIAPKPGESRKQGPNYNGALRPFVENEWDPTQARRNSPSLDRAIRALEALCSRRQQNT